MERKRPLNNLASFGLIAVDALRAMIPASGRSGATRRVISSNRLVSDARPWGRDWYDWSRQDERWLDGQSKHFYGR